LDRQRRYSEAWNYFIEANRAEYSRHEANYKKQRVRQDAVRKAADMLPVFRDRPPVLDNCPISLFIIGASRSGKTTLERLASTLPGTKRGYENRIVDRAVRRASQLSDLPTLSIPNDLPQSLDSEFRKFYLEELKNAAGGAKIFTNTNPGMNYGLGRIAMVLPNSVFVFIKRDPYDVALRIFGKKYNTGNHYAYDIKTIFEYIAWYYEMVDLWLDKFPTVTRVIQYEAMIADPATALKVVADLCGVPMSDSPLPQLGDDRGCAAPYREMMDAALR
jgi:hypothetical protein